MARTAPPEDEFAEHIVDVDVTSEMQTSFLEYAYSVIYSRALPDAPVLLRELQTFTVRISAAGREPYAAWREGQHDDLVLAAGLAAWWAELSLRGPHRRRGPTRLRA